MSFTNFHCVSCRLETMSLYWSRARRRFTTLSGASKRENTQLLQTEFGLSVFTTWNDIFTDDPPLSPPNFIHISLGGITPSCHVSWPNLLIHVVCFIMCTAGIYLFFSSSRWNTTLAKSVTQARGAGRISWLPCRVRKEKGIDSAVTFTASKSFFILSLCFFSLLILILHAFIHLKAISVSI